MLQPLPSSDPQLKNVDAAFSAQAPLFDEYDKHNAILQWMREQVYRHLAEYLLPGESILDISAGTGIDAAHFARLGHPVFAVDIAKGMVREIERKVEAMGLSAFVEVQQRSFTDVASLAPKKFQHVLSNFGGLNCVSDLRPVAQQLTEILHPGATVTLVMMPRVCPWEMLHALKGNFRLAFRRFRRNGTIARVEGHSFLTTYHSPSSVIRSFGPRFKVKKLRGLASLSPPPYMETIPDRFPRFYKTLTAIDGSVSTFLPFNRWADHFILTLSFTG